MGFIHDVNLNFQGHLLKTSFLAPWLRQKSDSCVICYTNTTVGGLKADYVGVSRGQIP
jgi:hypothetical protein